MRWRAAPGLEMSVLRTLGALPRRALVFEDRGELPCYLFLRGCVARAGAVMGYAMRRPALAACCTSKAAQGRAEIGCGAGQSYS